MQNAFVHTSYWSYFVCQRHFRALKLYVQNCTNLRKDCLRKNSILGGVFGIELTWYLVYLLFSIKKVLKIHRMNFTHSNPVCALNRKLYAGLKKVCQCRRLPRWQIWVMHMYLLWRYALDMLFDIAWENVASIIWCHIAQFYMMIILPKTHNWINCCNSIQGIQL